MDTTKQIKVRACSIQNTSNPDWGTFGVMEDLGEYYEIHGDAGRRTLTKREANAFWEVIQTNSQQIKTKTT